MIAAVVQASTCPHHGRGELTHVPPVRREVDQRNHRERELQAQDHLAQDQQPLGRILARQRDDHDRRDQGDQPGDQPAQPRGHPQAADSPPSRSGRPAFRSRSSSGRRTRARCRTGSARPCPGTGQQLVRLLDARDLHAMTVEHRRAHDQDRRVDEERHVQRDRRVEQVIAAGDRLARAIGRRSAGSAPGPNASTGCAASPWRPGCRSRRTTSPAGKARPQPRDDPAPGRAGPGRSGSGSSADRRHQRQDHGLDLPHSPALSTAAETCRRPSAGSPTSSGMPNSSFSAMTVPRISARSRRRDRDLGQHPEDGVEPPANTRPGRPAPGRGPSPPPAAPPGSAAGSPSGSTSAGPRSAHSRTGRRPPGPSPSSQGPCSRR